MNRSVKLECLSFLRCFPGRCWRGCPPHVSWSAPSGAKSALRAWTGEWMIFLQRSQSLSFRRKRTDCPKLDNPHDCWPAIVRAPQPLLPSTDPTTLSSSNSLSIPSALESLKGHPFSWDHKLWVLPQTCRCLRNQKSTDHSHVWGSTWRWWGFPTCLSRVREHRGCKC